MIAPAIPVPLSLSPSTSAATGGHRAGLACRERPLAAQDEALVAAAGEADRQAEHADVAHRGV
jgi:hypothetical protein